MFRMIVNDTPLVSSVADSYFVNINGDRWRNDATFLTTLRALISPRMSREESIILRFGDLTTPTGRINPDAFTSDGDGRIDVWSLNGSTEDNMKCMSEIKSSFGKSDDGWHLLEKVSDFFRKSFYVLCFINPRTKSVCLFVDNMDARRMHYLQCATLAFLPWYFNQESGISEIEMELIESLREKTPDKYNACVAKIAAQYDFRTQKIRNLLSGFETRFEQIECEQVRQNIRDIISRLEDLNTRIGDYLRSKAEMEIKLLGLETKIQQESSDDSEIMEYFLCNNNLVLEEVTDRSMIFSCMGYAEYFDEDMAKQVIDNRRSYIYRPNGRACNNYIPEDDMKRLMYAIFINQTVRLKLCASYRFELNGSVQALSGHNYGYEFRECTPNTHTDRYSCMGNYQRTINELLRDHNYIGAIEQCVASCCSLNFGDSTVMQEFMRRLYGISDYHVNIRCIELPDGEIVEPKEAIAWLKEWEGESVNEQAD